MSNWIKVSDRLPDDGVDVILAGLYNGQMKSDIGFYFEDKGGWDCYGYLEEVTHWMPLPEPPKERRDE